MLRIMLAVAEQIASEAVDNVKQKFDQVGQLIKDNQPIAFTGSLRHVGIWLTSGTEDLIFPNPKYVPCVNESVIIGVHGTADRVKAFQLLSERLLEDLPSHVKHIHLIAFNGRAQGNDIESFVEQLDEKIEECKYKNVILKGHSRGCLVVADYAVNRSKDRGVTVEAVLAVCGPFGGAGAASIWPIPQISASVSQMQKGSHYLVNDLCPKIKTSEIPFHYFGSNSDELVSVESAHIEENEASFTIVDRAHSHLSILSSWELKDAILVIIKALPGKEAEPASRLEF